MLHDVGSPADVHRDLLLLGRLDHFTSRANSCMDVQYNDL